VGGIYFFFFNKEAKKIQSKEKDIAQVFDPALLTWQEVTKSAPWLPRDSHAVVVYQDKMWLMGGLNGNGYVIRPGIVRYGEAPHFSDVWVSEDGINWSLVTEKAPWGKRRSIQAVVFQNKMWLIPGWGPFDGLKSEIWYSQDGIKWERVATSWPAREGHQLVVFQDKLWLIGGVNYEKRETKNDIWYSPDGINWFEATSAAPWSPRWDHKVVVFKDKLWLIGGMDLKNNVFRDIWVSENGKDWSLVTENPSWPARQGHEALVFKNRVWIIGRFNSPEQGDVKAAEAGASSSPNDVWFSDDGINWQKTKNDPPWQGREDHVAVVFQDKIWVLGGMTIDWRWQNDIWQSTF
jgi:N-acetylneuraminic acid mutarotase